MSALPRRVEFVLSLPLTATTDADAEGLELKQMLAFTAAKVLAEADAATLVRHIVVTDDVWTTTAPTARAAS